MNVLLESLSVNRHVGAASSRAAAAAAAAAISNELKPHLADLLGSGARDCNMSYYQQANKYQRTMCQYKQISVIPFHTLTSQCFALLIRTEGTWLEPT